MKASGSAAVSRPALRQEAGPDEWPHQSYLELGAFPGAVPCARLHARQVLSEWELPGFGDDLELLLSELVTNAIQASLPAEQMLPVRLWLSSDRSRLLIQVQDTSSHPPAPMGADGCDESGRGLIIVDAVSAKWGWYATKAHGGKARGGKIVWAVLQDLLQPMQHSAVSDNA